MLFKKKYDKMFRLIILFIFKYVFYHKSTRFFFNNIPIPPNNNKITPIINIITTISPGLSLSNTNIREVAVNIKRSNIKKLKDAIWILDLMHSS